MNYSTVTLNGQKFNRKLISHFHMPVLVKTNKLIYQSKHSKIYAAGKNLYKLTIEKHPIRGRLQLLGSRSKVCDEVRSNDFLQKIGFTVPKIIFHGSSPFHNEPKELIVMENLEQYQTISSSAEYLRQTGELNSTLIRIAQDINIMADHEAYYRDFHFSNVMISPHGELAWIDTAISRLQKDRLHAKINRKMSRLGPNVLRQEILRPDEWAIFTSHLRYG